MTMQEFLEAVTDHGVSTPEVLITRGYHPKVIEAKAEKAARQGYINYGVAVDRPWLTEEGQLFLAGDK